MKFTEDQINRYNRNILLQDIGVEGQKKICNGKVLIVGNGGLGSPVALYLAAAGVGTIGLIDGDAVDLSNLQRQVIHFTADLNRPKVLSAKEKINQLNPDVKVITHYTRLTPENAFDLIKDYDFVVDATDHSPSKFLINDTCVRAGKPFSHGGIFQFEGQTMTYVPGSACYRCLFQTQPSTVAVAGVLGAVAGTIGTIQAAETIKYLTGVGELLTNRLLSFDAKTMQFRTIRIKRLENCPVCNSQGIIVHAANNMIEDMRLPNPALIFAGLTEEYIDSKIAEHKSLPVKSSPEDIKILLSHGGEIASLFGKPSLYKNGIKLKFKIQKLLELFYLDAMLARNSKDTKLLLGLLYKIYSGIDSAVLQEPLVRDTKMTFIDTGKISNLQLEMLNFFFTFNDFIFTSIHNDADNLYRVENQSGISHLFLLMAEDSAAPDSKTSIFNTFVGSKKYGTISKQIFLSEYINVFHEVPIDYLQKVLALNAESLAVIKDLYKCNFNLSGLLKDMYVSDIPLHIGHLSIKANGTLKEVYGILSDKKYPIENRLYALVTISKMEYSSKSLKSLLTIGNDFGKSLTDSPDYGQQLLDDDLAMELAEKSRIFLDNLVKSKVDLGDDFLNAAEAEIVYAALSIIVRNNNKDIDPVDLLKQLAYVFGEKSGVEMTVKLTGNNAEFFNVSLKSGKVYVDSIEKIVSKAMAYI